MQKEVLTKKISDFLDSEKTGEGKELSKVFKDALDKFFQEAVYEAVKDAIKEVPMKESVPEADASVVGKFKHPLKKEVYYILFKQVRKQMPNSLRVKFGWQYAVLKGKTEEIQVRADHGILYKINGDWVLQDHTFSTEEKAVERCNILNGGTSEFAIASELS